MSALEILGTAVGIGFLSGLRLYATVLAVGLAIRFGIFELHPEMAPLQILADGRVLAAAGVAYLVEFFADKIPWLDSAWDTLHTFIRPVGAALLAAAVFGNLDPTARLLLALLCGGVALTGHSAKAATRLAINHSPEPFSNVATSFAEDLFLPAGLWFVFAHPVAALAIFTGFLAVFLWLSPKVFRLLRLELTALRCLVARLFAGSQAVSSNLDPRWTELRLYMTQLPGNYAKLADCQAGIYASATKSLPGLKHALGFLCLKQDSAVFVCRRWFRPRMVAFEIRGMRLRKGLLFDQLMLATSEGELRFLLFKVAPLAQGAPQRTPASAV